jgi:hypothetical protein
MSATSNFYSSITQGNLPVAVPVRHLDGRTGLMGGGLVLDGDLRAEAMVYSHDYQERAAASVIACTQVSRAAQMSALEPAVAQT